MKSPLSDFQAGDEPGWQRMLVARPVPNAAAEIQSANGSVKITVATRRPSFLVPPLSWVIRTRRSRTVNLDRLGSRIWSWCDGRRTVEAIIDLFAHEQELTFHESRVAVTAYLRDLVQRGALAMVIEEPSPAPQASQASTAG